MSIVAPTGRQHLSADALFRLVRTGFAALPAQRSAETELAFTAALLAAFAMFALQAPSWLACDTQRAESHVGTIDGMERVPCDTHRREKLAPVSPESLRPVVKRVCRHLQRGKALEPMASLAGHSLLALDGTGYFSSQTMHCASCVHQVHRHGAVTSFPQMVGAALLHPDVRAVIPLLPEPLVTHDGTGKNDGERQAAKRVMTTLRQDHPHRKFMMTADSRRAHAPPIATLSDHDLPDMFGVNAGDQALLVQPVPAAEHTGRVTSYARHDRAAGLVHRFRFANHVPLKASHVAIRVTFSAYWAMGDGKGPHGRWVTDLRVSPRNVLHLMRGGRARWKSAHETGHTLKNQGDNFAHTDGHGTQNLSVGFATVMLLAFLVDQTPQLCWGFCRAGWAQRGSKRLVWERRRALCYDDRLASMREWLEALVYGCEKPRLLLITDTSEIPRVALRCWWRSPAILTRPRRCRPKASHRPVFRPTWRLVGSPFAGHEAKTDDQTAPLTAKEDVARL